MTQAVRTAREVVELYNLAVWNERDFALAEELFAEEVVRHGVDEVVTLTREQAEMTDHEGTEDAIASIEVFRVVDGRIAEVWNNTQQHGVWR
jgi:hypothetical protein